MSLRIALYTPIPKLANELCEVIKLFDIVEAYTVNYKSGETYEDRELLFHAFFDYGNEWCCAFTFREQTRARFLDVPADVAPEHRAILMKRLKKRLCKMTLYDLLKEITGKKPAWGSLTGIRPTRLVYENMTYGYSLNDAVSVLIQAYDLRADKADLLRRIVAQQLALPKPAWDEADVYLSIPFCRTRCAYCSFPGESVPGGDGTKAYLSALLLELEATASLMKNNAWKPRCIYLGGGTPTVLAETELHKLMKAVRELFPFTREFTAEAGRPDTITPGKLHILYDFGVTRLSVNPQTMNDNTLLRIGRHHTAAETIAAFTLAREMGFTNINMDVIAGLPGETVEDFAQTMEAIVRLAPDSLTVHTLAIKRSSRLNLEKAPLPAAKIVEQMVALGEKAALSMNMTPYYLYRQKYMAGQLQNVGYARKGAACLYNVDVMEENTSVFANGAGAISKRVYPDRELRIERSPNVSNVAIYIERTAEMIERKARLFIDTK